MYHNKCQADTVTQSSLEKECIRNNTGDKYYTEKETMKKCYRLQYKYKIGLDTIKEGWFDHQITLGKILGIDYSDLYLKAVNLESLFKLANLQRANG